VSDFDGRDISFETLAQCCGIDLAQLTAVSRGQLNAALKQLRDATPDYSDLELALVIEDKARAYKRSMPQVMLTPSALAKHWPQLDSLGESRNYPPTNPDVCPTCDGLHLIPSKRPVDPGYDTAYIRCPDCTGNKRSKLIP